MTHIHPVKLGFVTCFVVESVNGIILVDAGYPKKEKLLWKFLTEKNIEPPDIKLIIITHGHVDHVGSLKGIKEKTGAPVLIHADEGPLLERGVTPGVHPTLKWLSKIIRMENGTKVTPVTPDILITDEYPLDEFGIQGKVIPTPGHTSGSLTVIIEGKYAIVGDTAMKFPLLSRSYKPIIANDMDEVFQSWQRIIDEGVETVYPAHGSIIGIDVLKKILSA